MRKIMLILWNNQA